MEASAYSLIGHCPRDYYGPVGFAAVLSDLGEPMYDLNMKVTADLIMQKEIAKSRSTASYRKQLRREMRLTESAAMLILSPLTTY